MEMMSAQVNELFTALSKAQAEMKVAPKDSNNPFFKSKYADLQTVWETIKEPLTRHGLSVVQMVDEAGDNARLITILGHSSGQWIKSAAPIRLKPVREKNGKEYETNLTAQELCAAVTYYRRMAISAATGCYAGEADDDGESAVGRPPEKNQINKPKAIQMPADEGKILAPIIKISREQAVTIRDILIPYPQLKEQLLKHFGVTLISDIDHRDFKEVMDIITHAKETQGAA